jgi:hypothetical protein
LQPFVPIERKKRKKSEVWLNQRTALAVQVADEFDLFGSFFASVEQKSVNIAVFDAWGRPVKLP